MRFSMFWLAVTGILCPAVGADIDPAHKALIENTYQHIATDPDKAAALMRFSRPEEGRQVMAALANVARDWQALHDLCVKQLNGELAEGGATGAIGIPLRLPRNLDQFNELDDAIASVDER